MKKILVLLSCIAAMAINTVVGGTVGGFLTFGSSVGYYVGAFALNAITITPVLFNYLAGGDIGPYQRPHLYEGLSAEVWIDELLRDFIPEDSILADFRDLSQWVENDKINYASVGNRPAVVVNRPLNTAIPMSPRTDTPLSKELLEFSTNSTLVQDAEVVELVYDKLASVNLDHKEALYLEGLSRGIYGVAPTTNTTKTPVFYSSGAGLSYADAGLTGDRKGITKEDVAAFALRLTRAGVPEAGRVLVMNPEAYWGLVSTDATLLAQAHYNQQNGINGKLIQLFTFTIKVSEKTPLYNSLTKKAYGATTVAASDLPSCLAYIAQKSAMKAMGTTKMYQEDSATYQGTIINYRMRFLAEAFDQRLIGAIVQPTV